MPELTNDISLDTVSSLIQQLSMKKLEELLGMFERGELMPQTETISLEQMAKETYGRFYKKVPAIMHKTASEFSYSIPEDAYGISTLRLRGRKLVAPKKSLTWWTDRLKTYAVGSSILYIDPPMSEFVFADKIIYTKISETEATREIVYFTEIPEVFLYPGIRADVGEALGIEDEKKLHAVFNLYMDVYNSNKQAHQAVLKWAEKAKKRSIRR